MKSGDIIKLTKLESVNDSKMNPGYWIIGALAHDIEINHPITVWREIKNGVEIPGYFKSSFVTKVENNIIYTENSIYKIESLESL